jgi:TolB protein
LFILTDITNPYYSGEPVKDPTRLFGRQDAADWVELQIAGNNRVLVLSASPLIGKTSFLLHAGTLQYTDALNVLVSLSDLPVVGAGRSIKGQDEQTLNPVLQAIIDQLIPQLQQQNLLAPQYEPALPQMASTLRELFTQANQHLELDQKLVLYIDDLHALVTDDLALVAGFLTTLMPLLDDCSGLYLVFTVNQAPLKYIRHPLLDGAPTFNLGALALDASINMITLPVKDILRFDYGVTKRIAEINSHHPYYLSLFCHTLLNRQVHDGWVNQRDFDATLVEILASPVEPFTRIWDESTWPERAVLSSMAAIQGAHGPITDQEILRALQKQSPLVVPEVVTYALDTLVARGVLIPMGAVSYRFHVDLFRFWLREHTTSAENLAEVNWNRAMARLRAMAQEDVSARSAARRAPVPAEPRRTSQRTLWSVVIVGGLLCALVAAGSVFAAQVLGIPIAFLSQPTPTATPTATATSEAIAPLTEVTPAATMEPTSTATPTPPVVVARTLPSITYMGRDVDQNWLIYVMNADGSGVTPLSLNGGDDTGPVWSPDGQKIAYVSRRDGNREIYMIDSDGQNIANVTRHPADDWTPAWSSDGSQLAFSSFREGSWEIFVMDTVCLDAPESCPNSLTQITADGNGNLSPVWSSDGTRFAFNSKANGNWDIFTMALDGSDVRQVTTAPENDLAPAWSPDGTQLAFESNREGNVEIYIVDAGGGVARNITNLPLADDHGPTWSPDGQQLVFYSNREGNWDIFVTTSDGEIVTNLTQTPTRDEQTPSWRP